MLQPITYGVEDHGIGNDFVPVVHGELGGERDRLIDGSLLDDLAQILGFGRGKFPHAYLVKDDQIELGELGPIPQIVPAGSGDGEVFLKRSDAHVEHRFAAFTGMQAHGLGNEGLADPGRTSDIVPNRTYST